MPGLATKWLARRMTLAADDGPRCERCHGPSTRAVRTRKLAAPAEPVYYLTYFWSCSVCGRAWVDDELERLNACAEQDAHGTARRAS
jgi:uncharacterized protein with PIN domain